MISIVVALLAAEGTLRLLGLGDPVMYDIDSACGYRLRPNQRVRRFGGAIVQINNLGVRACEDWKGPDHKVLFVGDSVTYGGSYVSTPDLFAVRAVPAGWTGGSAGTNGWGIENMHGLIVRGGFLPATVYVTVLIERDFYRGFTQRGPLYRTTKPWSALSELGLHVWRNVNGRLVGSSAAVPRPPVSGPAERVRSAVEHLVDMDRFLRERRFVHLMYISPTRSNVVEGVPGDPTVERELARAPIQVVRLRDRIERLGMTPTDRAALFHDEYHLTVRGHEVWASVIQPDLETIKVTQLPEESARAASEVTP